MESSGILDIDVICQKKIFKYLTPLDLCSVRQSCAQLKDFVDDYSRSLYLARGQCLDLTAENIRNVEKILTNFGKFVRCLRVGRTEIELNVLLDDDCCLTIDALQLYETDMEKLAGVSDSLEILELIRCDGYQQCFENILLGHEYPNLTKLKIRCSDVGEEILKEFFMRPRNISQLIDIDATEIDELRFCLDDNRVLRSVTQLRKLKRLEFDGCRFDQRSIIALIKELSVNNELEIIGIGNEYFHFTDEFYDALSHLSNLKELRLSGTFTLKETKSIEMLGLKLSKLESLMLVNCRDFPYRNFLASACKSNTFRTIYVWLKNVRETNNFIEQTVRDFIEGRCHRCFVSGNPLCIYVNEDNFTVIIGLLTQDNLQSIEKYGNIKILSAKRGIFLNGTLK